jgi:hypothetical protein
VGIVPLLIGCAVNYSKFGVLFGVSNFEQVWTHVNAYRRRFLAANHNAEEGLIFVPTNVLAYLRPNGLRLTDVFPFITLPAGPPLSVGGVLFDRRYRTASLPASMPLLFLLSLWGLVTAFRPKPIGQVALTRILLLSAGSAGAALLLWGYIAPRYLGDFVPFLVIASAVAIVDIWRRLEGKTRSVRIGAFGIIALVALFSVVANIGIAITPNEEFNTVQVFHYVEAQKALSDITGHPIDSRVMRGRSLPAWAPADQLFVIGNCDGLYVSNGEDYSTVPSEQYQRTTWMAVERGHAFQHSYAITFGDPGSSGTESRPLVTAGSSTVGVTVASTPSPGRVRVTFDQYGQGPPRHGYSIDVRAGSTQQVVVITDPAKHLVQVTIGATTTLSGTLAKGEPIYDDVDGAASRSNSSALSVVDETVSSPQPKLCQSLNP